MPGTFEVSSPVVKRDETIPVEYTCDSANVSPELHIGKVPRETESIALICEDPDAPKGLFTHWILFNIPPEVKDLPKGVPTAPELNNGARQGKNDAGKIGYTGPCPPSGMHRYFFRLFALDTKLDLPPGIDRQQFMEAIRGHILAEGEIMTTYAREGAS
jgi:Raf kinase inhibitor-like YbhB/YbcL family protein